MDYNFKEIERKWQAYWAANQRINIRVKIFAPNPHIREILRQILTRTFRERGDQGTPPLSNDQPPGGTLPSNCTSP